MSDKRDDAYQALELAGRRARGAEDRESTARGELCRLEELACDFERGVSRSRETVERFAQMTWNHADDVGRAAPDGFELAACACRGLIADALELAEERCAQARRELADAQEARSVAARGLLELDDRRGDVP